MDATVIYDRVSTGKQVDGFSLTGQADRCREYAQTNNLPPILTELTDVWSGMKLKRKGLDHLLEMIRDGVITDVVVASQDRFSRSVGHLMQLLAEIEGTGIKIHFVREGGLFDHSPAAYLKLTMLAGVSQYEWHTIRSRTRDGIETKLKGGKIVGQGRAPYGYAWIGERRSRELVIYEPEAVIVRDIYDLYDRGCSLWKIAHILTDRQIPRYCDRPGTKGLLAIATKQDMGHWCPTTIQKMIRNRRYTGEFIVTHNKQQFIVRIPRIIDDTLWNRCNARANIAKVMSPRNNTRHTYLLRSRMTCANCGATLIGSASRDKRRYRCGNRYGQSTKQCHTNAIISADRIEDEVWQWLAKNLTVEKIRIGIDEQRRTREDARERAAGQRERLLADRERLQAECTSFWEQWMLKRMSDDQRDRLIAPREAQIAGIDDALKNLAIPDDNHADEESRILVEVAAVEKVIQSGGMFSAENKQRIIDRLDVRLIVSAAGYADITCSLLRKDADRVHFVETCLYAQAYKIHDRIWLTAA